MKLPEEWVNRPRLCIAEISVFNEFLRMARSCGGEIKPTEIKAWMEMRNVPQSERSWMANIYGIMSAVLREGRNKED